MGFNGLGKGQIQTHVQKLGVIPRKTFLAPFKNVFNRIYCHFQIFIELVANTYLLLTCHMQSVLKGNIDATFQLSNFETTCYFYIAI